MQEPVQAVKSAIIVGASRGLGLGLAAEYLALGWRVVATFRDECGRQALYNLLSMYPDRLTLVAFDITSNDDIRSLSASLAGQNHDLLFINAGVSGDPSLPIETAGREQFLQVMETNAFAPANAVAALKQHVKRGGTIAAMSSNMASISGNNGGEWEIYRASKAALNQLFKSIAHRNAGDGLGYMLVSPGWVRTDMGGGNAPLDIATSIKGITAVLDRHAGEVGIRFLDYRGQTVDW